MLRLARLALLLGLAGCSSDELAKVLDHTQIKAACGTPTALEPLGGAMHALWIPCAGNQTFQLWDGAVFHKVDLPGGVFAQSMLPAPDQSLWVTTRDPAEPTTTNARLLQRVFADGHFEDHTPEVSPNRNEDLKLLGLGGVILVTRGMNLYLVAGDHVTALKAPLDGNFHVLNVLPVLGDGKLDRFFLYVAIGLGAPASAKDTRLFLFKDGAFSSALTVSDAKSVLHYTGYPALFVPLGEALYGLASRVPPQDRIVPVTVARWDGAALSPVEYKISVENGYFGPQQLYLRGSGEVVVLGTESEGNTSVVNRLASYLFTGEDFRKRAAFQTIQDCSAATCSKSASDPVFLTDGAVLYRIGDQDGSFEIRVGKL